MHEKSLIWAGFLSIAIHAIGLYVAAMQWSADSSVSRTRGAAAYLGASLRRRVTEVAPPDSDRAEQRPSALARYEERVPSVKELGGAVGGAAAESAPAGPGGSTDSRYLPAGDLDKAPTPLSNLYFPYPELPDGEQEGAIDMTLFIDRTGRVDDIRINASSVSGHIVDLAVESLRSALFVPGERNGEPVPASFRLAIDYSLTADGGPTAD